MDIQYAHAHTNKTDKHKNSWLGAAANDRPAEAGLCIGYTHEPPIQRDDLDAVHSTDLIAKIPPGDLKKQVNNAETADVVFECHRCKIFACLLGGDTRAFDFVPVLTFWVVFTDCVFVNKQSGRHI